MNGSQVSPHLTSDVQSSAVIAKGEIAACPRCSERLVRIRRRPIDRMLSLVRPARRFRCYNAACQWEGLRSLRQLRRPEATADWAAHALQLR